MISGLAFCCALKTNLTPTAVIATEAVTIKA